MLTRAAHHELQLDCETGVGLTGIDTSVVLDEVDLYTEADDTLMTETSGSGSWEAISQPSPGQFENGNAGAISSNGERIAAVRAVLAVYTSDDRGLNWVLRGTPPGASRIYAPVFGNGVWVMPTEIPNNVVYRSTDNAETFSSVPAAALNCSGCAVYANGVHVQMNANGTASQHSFDDGLTWTAGAGVPFGGVRVMMYTGARIVIVGVGGGANSAWSTDYGATWNLTTLPADCSFGANNGNQIVLCRDPGFDTTEYITSEDGGLTWTLRNLPLADRWFNIRFGGGVFLMTSRFVPSLYSLTGVGDWTATSQVLASSNSQFAYAEPYFVAVTAAANTNAQRFRVPSSADSVPIILDTKQTQGVIPKVMLRWSDDGGHTWSREHWREMGRIGEFETRVIWRRLGMTMKLRDRVYEVSGTDPIKIAIMGAELHMSKTSA